MNRRNRPSSLHEKLEDRILFDAVPDGSLDQLEKLVAEAIHSAESGQDHVAVNPATDLAQHANPQTRNEIAFVDKSVEAYEVLVAELVVTNQADVVFLNSNEDGLKQIARALDGRSDLGAIHVICHGEPGRLCLGNCVLDADSMQNKYLGELAAIRDALSEAGDILIYGCDLAGTAAGRDFVDALSEMTSADVAASTNGAGHGQLGGDWVLEHATSSIDAGLIVSEPVQSDWKHLLAEGLTTVEAGGVIVDMGRDISGIVAANIVAQRSLFNYLLQISLESAPDAAIDQLKQLFSEAIDLLPWEQNEHLAQQAGSRDPNEIVFVDRAVAGYELLVAELDTNQVDVVFLNPDEDGLGQIMRALNGRSDLDAIHIISHGEHGRLFVGNEVLDAESMQGEHRDELALIGQALSADGDILLYGCELAGNAEGELFLEAFSELTGADVAASDDLTGHAELGGDWVLETEIGIIGSTSVVAAAWNGLLSGGSQTFTVVDTGGSDDVTNPERNDLTQLSVDYSNTASNEITVQLQFDEVQANGGSTVNGSVIFDIDHDGNTDYSYFVVLSDPVMLNDAADTVTAANVDVNGDGTLDSLTLGTATLITDDLGNPLGTMTVHADGSYDFAPDAAYSGPRPEIHFSAQDPLGGTYSGVVPGHLAIEVFELLDGSGDKSTVKLSGSTTQVPLIGSMAVATLGTNPFTGDADTLITMTLDVTEIINNEASKGNTITADDVKLINASTHPSHSATSNPAESILEAKANPFLTDDLASTNEDTAVTIDVLTNDSGAAPSSLTIKTAPANGSVTINPDGTFTYTPDADFSGTDTLQYAMCWLDGVEYVATVTVNVSPVADAPTISASNTSGQLDTSYPVTITNALSDTDGSESLSVVTLSGVDPSLTFSSTSGVVTNLGGGLWSVSQDALATLSVIGTVQGTYSITASVTSTEASNGDTATASTTFEIAFGPASVGVAIDDVTVNEAAGTMTFTVSLDTASGQTVSVDYATTSGTAASGADFSAASGTLIFASGVTSQTIEIIINEDNVYEGSETFNVNLSNATNASITDGTGLGTILDDGDRPTVSVGDLTVTEGTDSHAVFTINVSNASVEDIILTPSLTSGTATAGTDTGSGLEYFDGAGWAAVTGDVTIPAGQTSLQVRVAVTNDTIEEIAETFELTLAHVSGAVAPAGNDYTATGTIHDNDAAPNLSIDDVTRNEAAGTMTFTVTLDVASENPISVDYATASGTAASDADFTATSGTLNFAAGETSKTITVNIANDNVYEESESYTVNLTSPSNATIADGTGVGSILDDGTGAGGTDDDRPTLGISDESDEEETDSHAVFTVSLGNASVEDTIITLTLNSGTATGGGQDFGDSTMSQLEYFNGVSWIDVPNDGRITIAAGSTSVQVRTPITDDPIKENTEQYTLNGVVAAGTTSNSSATGTGTITDDPTPDTTQVSLSGPTSLSEGDNATYTVQLDNAPATDVILTLNFSKPSGGADGGVDYTVVASVTIPAGSTSATFDLSSIDDSLSEPDEDFVVSIASVSGGSFEHLAVHPTNSSVTTTIIDDDKPTVSINDVVVNEGDDPHAEFTVQLSNASHEDISFSLSLNDGTANGLSVDYGSTGTDNIQVWDGSTWVNAAVATITAGDTSVRVRTPITDDFFAESVENFNITATVASGETTNASATGNGTIDDNATPSTAVVSITGPASVAEGATTANYAVTVDQPAVDVLKDITVTVKYNGTAVDGSDFDGLATVTIPAGSNSANFTFDTIDDALYEGGESIIVTIESVTGGGFEGIAAHATDNSVTTTITDVGDIPTVSVNNVTSIEGSDSHALFVVELSNLSVEDIAVDLALADGAATGGGSDYGSAGGGNLQVSTDGGTTWSDASSATIAAGQLSVLVRTPISDDSIDELSEDYQLQVAVTSGTVANTATIVGTGTIIDDDNPPELSINDVTRNESAGTMTFIVTLNAASEKPVSVDYATASGTAASGADFTSISGTLNFAAGETSKTVTVNIADDSLYEGSENYTVNLSNPTNSVISDGAGVGTILDDGTGTGGTDDDRPVVSVGDVTVTEGVDPYAVFTISLSNASVEDIVLTPSLSSGTATTGTDTGSGLEYFDGVSWVAVTGDVTIPAGQTSLQVRVAVTDDSVDEFDEDFTLTLAHVSGDIAASGNDLEAGGAVQDNDAAPGLSIDDVTRNEAAGTMTFTVTLDAASEKPVSVDYATASGTAASGADFTSISGTLNFAVGETSKTVTVNIADDSLYEGSENYTVNLSNPTNSVISDGAGVGTILDDGTGTGGTDDDRPVVSVGDVTVTEGVDPYAVFTISLSNASVEDIVLTPSLSSGTATTGTDTGSGLEFFDGVSWVAVTGDVTIPAGQTSLQLRVAVTDDAVDEFDESFDLALAHVSGAVAPAGNDYDATGAIQDNDAAPGLSIDDVTRNEAAGTMTFTVTLDAASEKPVSVDYATAGGTAAGGDDFTATSGALNFAAGETSKTVTVNIADDSLYEGSENYTVNLSNPTNSVISAGAGVGTILDDGTGTGGTDDDRPVVSVGDVTVTEGVDPYAVFTISLSNASVEDVVLTPSLSSGTADVGTDTGSGLEYFDGVSWVAVTGNLTVPAGQTSLQVRVAVTDDSVDEFDEDFTLTLAHVSGDIAASGNDLEAGGAVQDNDAAPGLSIDDVTRNEAAGTMTFTVTLDAASEKPVSVDYATAGGTAGGDDFAATSGALNFAAGETSQTITVNLSDDSLYEQSEDFSVMLSSPVNASVTDGTGTGTILDDGTGAGGTDDDRPTVTIGDASVAEGGAIVFNIGLTNPSTESIVLDLATTGGTAIDGTDYENTGFEYSADGGATWQTATNGTEVPIPAESTSILVRIDTTGDTTDEPDESFTLSVASVVSGTVIDSSDTGEGTISDNDPPPGLSIDDVTRNEAAGTMTFTVTLEAASAKPISVDFATVSGAATSGVDYAATSGTLNFSAGETSQTLTVNIANDSVYEGSESYTVQLMNPTNSVISDDTGVGTILDDGTGAAGTDDDRPTVSIGDATAGEGEPLVFDVTLSNLSVEDIVLDLSTTGGTATDGTDYENTSFEFSTDGGVTWQSAANGTEVTIPAGASGIQVRIDTAEDLTVESTEAMTLSVAGVVSGSVKDSSATAMGTVHDDDTARVSITATTNGDEDGSVDGLFTVSLTNPSSTDTTISYAVTGTATSASDFTALSGTVTIPAGSTSATIAVPTIDDALVEGDETVTVTLTNITSGDVDISIDSANDSADVTIADNDTADWSITGPTSGDEGSTATYNVALSGSFGAGDAVSVDIDLTDISTSGTDYANLVTAIGSAVTAYNVGDGEGTVSFNAITGTLTWTAASDGDTFGGLAIDLGLTNDAFVEGPEQFNIALNNAASTTGVSAGVDSVKDNVTTTINDTEGVGGSADGPATWSITGDTSADEGGTASYSVSMSSLLGAGETVTVDLALSDIDANSSDYGNFVTAVNAAVAAYTGDGTVSFDSATGTLAFTATNDGDAMGDLVIDLGISNDTLIEGAEQYKVALSNAASSTDAATSVDASASAVTTTVDDTNGVAGTSDGPAEWSIAGPTSIDEGGTASYNVALSGEYGAGENVTVDIDLSDIDTNSSDYADFVAAVNAAISAYSGDGSLAFDSINGTLTFTAANDGDSMSALTIDLGIANDNLLEGGEQFEITLSNAGSSTGLAPTIGSANDGVTTMINDTQGVGGPMDGPAAWSIAGSTSVDEGASATYTVSLSGTFGAGEAASVDLDLSDVDTAGSDYASFVAAVDAGVAAYNSGSGDGSLSFNTTTGTLTFAAANDGDTMDGFVISFDTTNDSFVEGAEDYNIALSDSASTTGVATAIDSNNDDVTTTINDTQGSGGAEDGPTTWSLTGPASSDEGSAATYTVSLSGTYGAGVGVSVDLVISDVSTSANDYAGFNAAVTAAVAVYNTDATKDGSLSWDGTTLTFTAANDGDAMGDLGIGLGITNDAFSEGPEQFNIALSNAAATNGITANVDSAKENVTTTIDDTQGVGGAADGPVQFSVTGDTDVDEGGAAAYAVTMTGTLGAGEVATVEIGLSETDTNSSDYANFVAAVNAAVTAYNSGGNPGTVAFDGTTLTFTAANDGEKMGQLLISLDAVDDSLVEGPENYDITLGNASSSTGANIGIDPASALVTTTIRDTIGDGGELESVQWNVIGDNSVLESGEAGYTISLDGQLQAGETAVVTLGINEIDTTTDDREALAAAVNDAIAAYTGPGSYSYNATTGELTFTSDGTAADPLVVGIDTLADSLVEGPEQYELALSLPGSTTGAQVTLDPTRDQVATTIQGDDLDAIWQITGDVSVDEGGTASYSVTMVNALQSGEAVSVEMGMTNLETGSADYADFNAAVADAVSAYNASTKPGSLAWDGTTLVFTSDGTGAMGSLDFDLSIVDDAAIEGPERYNIVLANPASSTGSGTSIDPAKDDVLTTIRDTVGDGGALEAAMWSLGVDQTVAEGVGGAYTINLTGDLQTGEVATVDVTLSDFSTTSGDYADFDAAMTAAVADYAAGGNPGSLTWDGTTLTFTSDGTGTMGTLNISLGTTNDVVAEGTEDFLIALGNPASSTGITVVTSATNDDAITTIDDSGGPGANDIQWSITGDDNVNEGSPASYAISMAGGSTPDVGEVMSITIGLNDMETNSGDYADLMAAVDAAVAAYTGPGNLTFNTATGVLTYENTESTPTKMGDLTFSLGTTGDTHSEGAERYDIQLTSPSSSTGLTVVTEAGKSQLVTTINDNDTVKWQITGDDTVDEGNTASYTVDLSGTLQAGETAIVQLGIADVDTTSADYAGFVAAVNTAIGSRTDVTFDAITGTLTFTGDGNAFAALNIDLASFDDNFVEGPELYRVELTNASSTTGAPVEVDAAANTVNTTIRDTVTVAGDLEEAVWTLAGVTNVDEGAAATYTLSLSSVMQSGETASIRLSIADVDTNSSDYEAFLAAVQDAVTASGRTDLSFDSTTGVLTFTSTGAAMPDFEFTLDAANDNLLEGPEDYRVTISTPNSATGAEVEVSATDFQVTTEINDVQSPGEWTITGDTSVDEGGAAGYTVALSGEYGGGEVVSVNIGLTAVDTNSSDYSDQLQAIRDAVDAYNADAMKDGTLVFDSAMGELTWTTNNDGDKFGGLPILLGITDDVFAEGPEDFTLSLSNAATATATPVTVGADSSVTTTIEDTQGVGGVADSPAQWSISGPTSGDEGSTPQYTVALTGAFGEGEVVTVDLGLTDIDTGSSDYADFVTAVKAAVAAYTGDGAVTFDETTGTLTYTAGADGDAMSDLVIDLPLTDDGLIEGPEDFTLGLSNATTSTGANVEVDPTAGSITATINDTQGVGGDADGPAQWSVSGPTSGDEGSTLQYTVALTGAFGEGEVVAVDLGLTDIDTGSSDYADFVTAVKAAVAAYTGDGAVTFDETTGTLTYTAGADGDAMSDLVIDLPLTDDGLIEGPEDFTLGLSNATTSTGANVEVDPTAGSITATINDTQGVGGDADGPAQWSVSGPTSGDEGSTLQYTVALTGAFGEGEVVAVDLGLTDIDTGSSDYADFVTAVKAAVAAYTGDGAVTFDETTGTLTYTAGADGDAMSDLVIDLPLTDDGLIEGPEDFTLGLSNATTSTGANVEVDPTAGSITATIHDTQGVGGDADGPAQWSVSGPTSGDEGSTLQYTVALTGAFGEGEVVAVDLGLTDIDTGSSDYADFVTAVKAAVAAYTGDGAVTFDETTGTLTYTAGADGDAMSDLVIDLPLTDDGLIEGPEDFTLGLSNATTSTGANVEVDPTAGSITATINDTQGVGGDADGPAQWSVSGPTSGDEGSTLQYTVALSGTFGEGEVVRVDLNLSDIGTNSSDYSDILQAIRDAAWANPDVVFDPATGTLTYTSPADGASMSDLIIDLPVTDDGLIEGPEDFTLGLTNASTSTGANVEVDPTAGVVTTTIDDTQGPNGPGDGPAEWSITGPSEGNEGADAVYTVSLSGTYQAGEVVSVNIGLTDIDTTSADYADFIASVTAAVDANPDVTFDPDTGELTYKAPTDGASMAPLEITLPLSSDLAHEAPEDFVVTLTSAGSSTGVTASVSSTSGSATTTVKSPPVGNPDINVIQVDTPVTGNVLTNDESSDGSDLTVTKVNGTNLDGSPFVTASGTVTMNPDGTYTYTPNADFTGTDTFEYEVCDENGLCVTETVTIEVRDTTDPTSSNTSPIASDDTASGQEGQPISGQLLSNDGDPDGDAVTINTTPVSGPANGTLTINSDGTFTYTPNAGFTGTDVFTYEICDASGACDKAAVTLTVRPDATPGENDAPSANDDVGIGRKNETVTGNILDNDSDPNGNELVLNTTPINGPANGTLTIESNGSYTYTPDNDFVGNDSFVYEVCDADGLCDQTTVYITIFDNPPIAENDIATTLIGAPVSGNVLTNDGDPNPSDTLTVNTTPVTAPTNGTVTLNQDGTFTYAPNAGFVGADSFEYEVCDEGGNCATAVVEVEVRDTAQVANRPPMAEDDATSAFTDTAVSGNVLGNDTDPENDALTVNTTPVSGPANGMLALNADGSFTYTPNPGFEGTDSFIYEVCDEAGDCDTAKVEIAVAPDPTPGENDPPIASPDAATNEEGKPIIGDLLINDTDPNGDLLTINTTPVTPPANGTLTINPDGTYVYIPNEGFTGADAFEYEVCDEGGACSTAIVTLTVTAVSVPNSPPIVNSESIITFVDQPVSGSMTSNDGDPEGGPITINITPVTPPANGTIVINPDGAYTYTPAPGFTGADTIEYEVCDDAGNCDTAILTVNVVVDANPSENDPPFAGEDAAIGTVNKPIEGDLLANDSDPNGDKLRINTTPVSGPTNGTLVIHLDGTYTYTPGPDFVGNDSFTYEVCDESGACDTATVQLTVFNQTPNATDDYARTPIGEPVTIPVLDNDIDPDGDPLSVIVLSVDQGGSAAVNPDGTVTFTPDLNFTGTATIQYLIEDPSGATSTATITVEVFLPYTWDSHHNFTEDFELSSDGSRPFVQPLLTKQIFTLAPEPIFSGYARPGTQVVGRIYDQSGRLMGESFAHADPGGNWMMQFQGVAKFEHYRIEFDYVMQSADIYGYLGLDPSDNSYSALQPLTGRDEPLSVEGAIRGASQTALRQMHNEHNRPQGMGRGTT